MSLAPYLCYLHVQAGVTGPRVKLESCAPNAAWTTFLGELHLEERIAQIRALHDRAAAGGLGRDEARTLGTLLHGALLDATMSAHLQAVYREAGQVEAPLFLALDLDDRVYPGIEALPWEFLRLPEGPDREAREFAGDAGVMLVREALSNVAAPRPARSGVLRAALAVSAPELDDDDREMGPVSADGVVLAMRRWAQASQGQVVPIEPFPRRNPTAAQVSRLLDEGPDVVHLIGHGRLRQRAQGAAADDSLAEIALVDPTGRYAEWLPADDVARLFQGRLPSLVVLHACESAAARPQRAFTGVASRLARAGVPVVVAMQYEISNAAAGRFADELYRGLARRLPVEQAVQAGRRLLAQQRDGLRSHEAATVVVFSRCEGGLRLAPSGRRRTEDAPAPVNPRFETLAPRLEALRAIVAGVAWPQDALCGLVHDLLPPNAWQGATAAAGSADWLEAALWRLLDAPAPRRADALSLPPLLGAVAALARLAPSKDVRSRLEQWLGGAAAALGLPAEAVQAAVQGADQGAPQRSETGEPIHLLIALVPPAPGADDSRLVAWLLEHDGEIRRQVRLPAEQSDVPVDDWDSAAFREWALAALNAMLGEIAIDLVRANNQLTVEFMLPYERLCQPVERWPTGNGSFPIGRRWPVVVRSYDRHHEGRLRPALAAWTTKWRRFKSGAAGWQIARAATAAACAPEELQALLGDAAAVCAALSVPPRCADPMLWTLIESGTPIALWPAAGAASDAALRRLLRTRAGLELLPQRLWEQRRAPRRSAAADPPVALLWDDADHLPPDSEFFEELQRMRRTA